ncbi:MAG: hypothetical protein ACRCVN_00215 [Spirochaetia bacterium]
MGDILDPLNDETDAAAPKGLSRPGGILGNSVLSFFVFIAFLSAAAILVGIVTTTAKTYVGRPAWLRHTQSRIPKRVEMNYLYTPEIALTGRTNDPGSYVYDIILAFGFSEKGKSIDPEIARRSLELQDLLRSFFSIRSWRDLSPEKEDQLKVELLQRINEFLKTGAVEEVLFLRLDVN